MQFLMKDSFNFLRRLADVDIEQALNSLFSGRINFTGLPSYMRDAFLLRFNLYKNGCCPCDFDPLLRRVLTFHLNISKRHAQLWTHPDPDLEELGDAHIETSEAVDQWDAFYEYAQKSTLHIETLKDAYEFAYLCFTRRHREDRKFMFGTPKERVIWLQLLKNEQQRDLILHKQLEEPKQELPYYLEDRRFYYQNKSVRLKPNLAELLEILLDGEPHSASELIPQVFGTKSLTQENRSKLSKRISELNTVFDKAFGRPYAGRWIQKQACISGDLPYRFRGISIQQDKPAIA